MVISSRTPEGRPNRCPVCGSDIVIEPSNPAGDAPCPACGHLLWFTFVESGDEHIVHMIGTRLQPDALDDVFDSAELLSGARVVIDFSEVQEASSAALAELIHLKRKFSVAKRTLVLRGLSENLSDVFRITRLDQVFEIERW
jgi:anti-anti-sigma factor